MQYGGSPQPYAGGGRAIGGGQSLEPRVLGGGLAALSGAQPQYGLGGGGGGSISVIAGGGISGLGGGLGGGGGSIGSIPVGGSVGGYGGLGVGGGISSISGGMGIGGYSQPRSLGFVDDGMAYRESSMTQSIGGGAWAAGIGGSLSAAVGGVGAQMISQPYGRQLQGGVSQIGNVTPTQYAPTRMIESDFVRAAPSQMYPQMARVAAQPVQELVREVPQYMVQESVMQARPMGMSSVMQGGIPQVVSSSGLGQFGTTMTSMVNAPPQYMNEVVREVPQYLVQETMLPMAAAVPQVVSSSGFAQFGNTMVSGQPTPARIISGGIQGVDSRPVMPQQVMTSQYGQQVMMTRPGGFQGAEPASASRVLLDPYRSQTGMSSAGQVITQQRQEGGVGNQPMSQKQLQQLQQQPTYVTQAAPTYVQPQQQPVASEPAAGQSVCSILPIPEEYMTHIFEDDLKQVQDVTGCTIQVSQPDAATGNLDWEVRLFGSAEARQTAHQALENMLNDRLASPEEQQAEAAQMEAAMEVLNLPNEYIRMLYQEDIDQVKIDADCDIQIGESENGEWTLTLVGSNESRDAAHRTIEDLLNQRMSQEEQPMEDQMQMGDQMQGGEIFPPEILGDIPKQIEQPQTMIVGDMQMMQQPQTMIVGDMQMMQQPQTMIVGDMQVEQPQTMMVGENGEANPNLEFDPQTQPVKSSVLQLEHDYYLLLTQQDFEDIVQGTGCQVEAVPAEQGPETGGWTMTLYGSDEAREAGHRAVEDIINNRLGTGQTTEDQQMEQQQFDQQQFDQQQFDQQQAEQLNYEEEMRFSNTEPADDGYIPGTMDPNQMMANVMRDGQEAEQDMVPCTILPISYDYLRRLYNLDAIQELTGCQMEVSQPEDGNGDWTLTLYGDPAQRQKAHQAIEDTLNAVMSDEPDGGEGVVS